MPRLRCRSATRALVASSGGCNLVPIEMAEGFRARGVKVVAIISRRHSEASTSQHAGGKKLQDFADLVLDTGAPVGDAMVRVPGLDTPGFEQEAAAWVARVRRRNHFDLRPWHDEGAEALKRESKFLAAGLEPSTEFPFSAG